MRDGEIASARIGLLRYDVAAVGSPFELEATRSSFSSWLDGADVPGERIKRLSVTPRAM
jgi:hypothetical protein